MDIHVTSLSPTLLESLRARAFDVDAQAQFPKQNVAELAAEGLWGLCVPRQFGGKGEGLRAFAAAAEALGGACASTAMIYVMHVTASQAIAQSRAPGREALLEEIARGQHLTTLALSERGSRSHFWAPLSQLKRDERGGLTVTAMKTFVTSAHHAHSFVSSSQHPDAQSPLETTMYLVKNQSPHVRVDGAFNGLGLRANDSAPVLVEGYTVPEEDVLTDHGGGAALMLNVILPWFAVGTSAMAVGLCRQAVRATSEHLGAAGFEHLGTQLRDLPTLRARLAEMSVRTEQAASLVESTLARLEADDPAAPLFVLQARLSALEAAVEVTDLAMKACGGAAFAGKLGIERNFRDARAGWVMAPTVDHLKEFVGRALTGLPLFG